MKAALNAWRHEPETWMEPKSMQKLNATENQQAEQQACKQRFNAMLFELFGNNTLVDLFIRFPICSAAQPAPILRGFAKAWCKYKDSLDHQKARGHSQKTIRSLD